MYAIKHVISAIPKDFIIEFKFFSGLKYNIPAHNSNKLASSSSVGSAGLQTGQTFG